MIPAWVAAYVGLPFRKNGRTRDGVDCWGLVRLVLMEQFGRDVPAWDGAHTGPDWPGVEAAVRRGLQDWTPIDVADAAVGDGVVLRVRGVPLHTAVVVDVAPLTVLHILPTLDSVCQRLDTAAWASRVSGVYRWAR